MASARDLVGYIIAGLPFVMLWGKLLASPYTYSIPYNYWMSRAAQKKKSRKFFLVGQTRANPIDKRIEVGHASIGAEQEDSAGAGKR
jgi:hypothetical protein